MKCQLRKTGRGLAAHERVNGRWMNSDGQHITAHPVVSLEEALLGRHNCDAHFSPYWLDSESTCPRLQKALFESLPVVFGALVLDSDDPETHGTEEPARPEWRATFWGHVTALETAIGSDVYAYETRGGGRVVVGVEPIGRAAFVSALAGFRAVGLSVGLVTDRLVDLGRCYRLPFVLRDEKRQEYPTRGRVVQLASETLAGLIARGEALAAEQPSRPRPPPAAPRGADDSDIRPGDMINRLSWAEILEPHGWVFMCMSGEQEHWCRPGKKAAKGAPPSAVTGYAGIDAIHVFTTSTNLEANRSYDKFGLFCALEGVSLTEGARLAIRRLGLERPTPINREPDEADIALKGWAESHKAKAREAAEAREEPKRMTSKTRALPWSGETMAGTFEYSQAGNAARFVSKFGHLVRYVPGVGWRVWDGTRWAIDVDTSQVLYIAHGVITDLDMEIAREISDEDARKKARAHRNATAAATGLSAMLKLAAGYPAVRAKATDFDADGWLVNTPAGTYDIRTGVMREHRQEDMITKITPFAPDFGAPCPRFDAFLASAMPDEADRAFLQRMTGYACSGVIREHVLTVNWGPEGRNGKTTFWEHAFAMAMGEDYAMPASRDMLLEPVRGQRGHPAELECLRGRRLVWSSEPPPFRRLDAELCKALSGNDALQSRGMRENFTTFRQTAKVTILANRLDVLKGLDAVTWNRLQIIMWPASFLGREDKALPEDLRAEGGAILAKILEWSQDWRINGLGVGAEGAKRDALRYTNPIEAFIREECEVGKDFKVANRDLHEAFQAFVASIGVDKDDDVPDTSDGFGRAIGSRFTSKPIHGIRYRIGIRLKSGLPASELPLSFFGVGHA